MKTISQWISPILLLGMTLAGCHGQGRTGEKDTAKATMPMDYTGVYLDDDCTDNNLTITPDSADGYHISIGIFRLATFDDGCGKPNADGLPFTATDPSGQSISGIIVFHADTAIVTFTDSHWDLIPNGEQFRYVRSTAQITTDRDLARMVIDRYRTDSMRSRCHRPDVRLRGGRALCCERRALCVG